MFDVSDMPRVFGVAPGADFPKVLVQGLQKRLEGFAPQDMARVQVIVNTSRMARRVNALFDCGPATLLPRIQLLSDVSKGAAAVLPSAASPLRHRLELIQLVTRLLDQQPDLAARASVYDLADSLATLFDEMQGESVPVDSIESLDVSDQSGHWARAQAFFGIARHFLDDVDATPSGEARQRQAIELLAESWRESPPRHPVILAGSTGSRGTMMLLMQAVAQLPQGAIVLPGFDFDTPLEAWAQMSDALDCEDHPQFRFAKLAANLDMEMGDIHPWVDVDSPNPARTKLVSLALRPAPVTDQWLSEGPSLQDLMGATSKVSLLEAATQREEALAIAARMRLAAEDGKTCALITPDRMLTRQVTAALDRWDIVPDDSAGTPLQLTPPGRLLRHISSLFHHKLTSETLLTLLKHPLSHSGSDRNFHLRWTRELELWIRRKGVTYPTEEALRAWALTYNDGQLVQDWVAWVVEVTCDQQRLGKVDLSQRLTEHIALAECIAHGPGEGSGGLWKEAAGRSAANLVAELRENSSAVGGISAADYADLFGAVLTRGEVRDRDAGHPNILIWGTLEARVQGADMVILGGLNEGSWPEAPAADPWLNRKMRHDAGLLLPERRIGLSAHDFQQAICAPEVWLTRSVRSDEAETVPSRWLNRLMNLLEGLPDQDGPEALAQMQAHGQLWLNRVRALETYDDVPAAKRPSPTPPAGARPLKMSVTEVKRLIRDPYAIYAKHVLRLRPLDPLMRTPDALLRGIVLHEVLEKLVKEGAQDKSPITRDRLLEIAQNVLSQKVPWPTARTLWQARLDRVADHFVEGEKARHARGVPIAYERRARASIPELGFDLTGTADRIDRTPNGDLILYDYKTGTPPSRDEQLYFDKQLLLEAAIARQGGFEEIDPADVADAVYIGLGPKPRDLSAPLAETPPEQIWEEFTALISQYVADGKGFTSRRAMQSDANAGGYDQLARFGEWDVTDEPEPQDLS